MSSTKEFLHNALVKVSKQLPILTSEDMKALSDMTDRALQMVTPNDVHIKVRNGMIIIDVVAGQSMVEVGYAHRIVKHMDNVRKHVVINRNTKHVGYKVRQHNISMYVH